MMKLTVEKLIELISIVNKKVPNNILKTTQVLYIHNVLKFWHDLLFLSTPFFFFFLNLSPYVFNQASNLALFSLLVLYSCLYLVDVLGSISYHSGRLPSNKNVVSAICIQYLYPDVHILCMHSVLTEHMVFLR